MMLVQLLVDSSAMIRDPRLLGLALRRSLDGGRAVTIGAFAIQLAFRFPVPQVARGAVRAAHDGEGAVERDVQRQNVAPGREDACPIVRTLVALPPKTAPFALNTVFTATAPDGGLVLT